MTCPTCASPLPAGAMFCGECGRAVTSADVADQRAATEAARRSAGSPPAPAPPVWHERTDRRAPGHDAEPWWVRDRVEPDAAPGTAGHHLGVAPGSAPTPVPATPAAPDAPRPVRPTPPGPDLTSWPPPVVPVAGAGAATGPAGGPRPDPRPEDPRASSTGERPPVEPPVLRTPVTADDSSPRPTSAPLWTASLAPLPVEQVDTDADADAEADADAPRPGNTGRGPASHPDQVVHHGRDGGTEVDEEPPGAGTTGDHVDAPAEPTGDAASVRASASADPQTEIDLDEGDGTGGAPAPGDTALLERLLPDVAPAVPSDDVPTDDVPADDVPADADAPRESGGEATTAVAGESTSAPPALVEPGSAGERCTQCGGPIHEDDIFCGECGAVVQSVARSFTGPVAPLPPEWHAPVVDVPAPTPDADVPEVGDTGSGRPSGRRARAVPPDEPRQVRPERPGGSDRVPGSEPAVPGPAVSGPAVSGPAVPGPAATDPAGAASVGDETADAVKRRLVDEAARRALAWPPPAATDADVPAPPTAGRTARAWTPPAPTDDAATTADPSVEPSADPGVRAAPALPPVDHVPGVVRDVPASHPEAPAVPSAPPGRAAAGASPWSALRAPAARQGGTGDPAEADDVDETRIVARRQGEITFGLQFSTGESVTVWGSGLAGRAPVAQPGERFEHLVRIVDPGKSVSKTHLEFGVEGGHLWVSDRWSGNGTLVRAVDEPPRRVQPGTRVRVPRGARVDIGEQFFLVQ